jgi:hypothetical protein
MSRTLRTRTAGLLLAALVLSVLTAGPAAAHGEFKAGALTFAGFGLTGEPVLAGEETAFEFTVTKAGQPVAWTDAQLKQLAVHVFVGSVKPSPALAARQPGGKPLQLALHGTPWEGPGAYQTDAFILSDPGTYTAHLHSPLEGVAGATKTIPVGGQVIDLVAPMGPDTYGPIETLTSWPRVLPTASELATADQTTTAELAALDSAVADLQTQADQTRTLLLGTLAVAVATVGVAGVALVTGRRRRRRQRVPDSPADLDRVGRR